MKLVCNSETIDPPILHPEAGVVDELHDEWPSGFLNTEPAEG